MIKGEGRVVRMVMARALAPEARACHAEKQKRVKKVLGRDSRYSPHPELQQFPQPTSKDSRTGLFIGKVANPSNEVATKWTNVHAPRCITQGKPQSTSHLRPSDPGRRSQKAGLWQPIRICLLTCGKPRDSLQNSTDMQHLGWVHYAHLGNIMCTRACTHI